MIYVNTAKAAALLLPLLSRRGDGIHVAPPFCCGMRCGNFLWHVHWMSAPMKPQVARMEGLRRAFLDVPGQNEVIHKNSFTMILKGTHYVKPKMA